MSGYHKRDLDNFPMHKIKRVDRPTTIIHDNEVKRVDERDSGFNKAAAGLYGPILARGEASVRDEAPALGGPGNDAALLA